jgi:hypothetical protein
MKKRNSTMNRSHQLLGASLLISLFACGGGGGGDTPNPPPASPKASGLLYTDPSGTGWRFVKDGSSTSTHLVLNLLGPSAGSGHGVAFTLAVDPAKATWSKVVPADSEYVKNVAYNLGSGSQFFKSRVQAGSLSVGVFQKGVAGAAVPYSGPLVRVALDFVSGSAPNTAIPITVSGTQELTASGMGPITVAAGTLVAQ